MSSDRGTRGTRAELLRWVLVGLVVVYLGGVAFATFGPEPGDRIDQVTGTIKDTERKVKEKTGRERPERSVADEDWFPDVNAEELGNVAMFVPLGLLFPLLLPRLRWLTIPAGMATSGCIELVQLTLLTHRTPSWRDIWWNSWGAAVGFVLYLVGRWAWSWFGPRPVSGVDA